MRGQVDRPAARAYRGAMALIALLLVCLHVLAGCRPSARPTDATPPTAPVREPAVGGKTAAAPTATPPSAALNKRGLHFLLDDGGARWPSDVWQEHVEWAARLVGPGGHAVQLIRSTDLRPETWQPFFDLLAREGLVPIVRLATEQNSLRQWWEAPTPDSDGGYRAEAERVRRFFEGIAWRTERVVVTVGNEPNRPDEWGGAADPAAYARYLRDVAEALRRVSGVGVVVLNAGLDTFAPSTGGPDNVSVDPERFIEGMAAAVPGIFDLLDGWASHSYPLGPFGEHPARQQFRIDDVRPDAPPHPGPPVGIPNRGINAYDWELWKLARLGVGRELPVYVTESGWRHLDSQVPFSLDRKHAAVDDERLDHYIALAFDGPAPAPADPPPVGTADEWGYEVIGWTPWNDDPRVRAVALFALGGRPERWGHTNLLLLDPSGRVLGPYPFARRLASVRPGPLPDGSPAGTVSR